MKGLVARATLFVYFPYFVTYIHSITFIQYVIYPSPFAGGLSPSHRLLAQWEKPPSGAEPISTQLSVWYRGRCAALPVPGHRMC
jgi:hypothetical protein